MNSLQKNPGFADLRVIIYSDGPRHGDEASVSKFREEIRPMLKGSNIKLFESEKNFHYSKFLLVQGILLCGHDLLVLEDDNVVSPNFIKFILDAQAFYKFHPRVASVSGHSHFFTIPKDYRFDTFLAARFNGYGCLVFANKIEFSPFDSNFNSTHYFRRSFIKKFWKSFCYNGFDLIQMLLGESERRLGDIRYSLINIERGYLQAAPIRSLVVNTGLDGSGVSGLNMPDTSIVNGSFDPEFSPTVFQAEEDEGLLIEYGKRWNREEVILFWRDLIRPFDDDLTDFILVRK